jgi:virginiamycin A acetyltransferase
MNRATVINVPAGTPSVLKRFARPFARAVATIVVSPLLLSYWVNAAICGHARALETRTQVLSLFPGFIGQYLRRAFLQQVLARCDPTVTVEFGTFFSQPGAILDAAVYIGPRCIIGLVHLERDVMVAANVQILSGGRQHYFDDPTRPINQQGGERRMVSIGENAWIGAGAIILAGVGKGTIVAAGSVVTNPLPDDVIAAGVPAKVIRSRFEKVAKSDEDNT